MVCVVGENNFKSRTNPMPRKTAVSSYHNKNLVGLFSKHLSHLEHFVFYGTLLGLVREGKPIEGDDDVDILVHKNHFNEVKAIVKSLNFIIHDKKFPNTTKFFFQALGQIEGTDVIIDFYFYYINFFKLKCFKPI